MSISSLLAAVRESLEFGAPQYLTFVPLAAACLLLAAIVQFLKVRGRPPRTHGSTYPLVGRTKLWFAATMVLALAALAAAQPLFVYGGSSFKRGSVDVPIALDVSASMWVKDLGPSRLQVAIREILTLQSEGILQTGDRAGLFVFGGTTIRKVHLSTNIERLVEVVGKLTPPDTLTGDAFPWDSDVASAFEHIYQSVDSQDRFEAGMDESDWTPARRSDRAVILVTDGDFAADQAQMQRLDAALAEFRRRGLAVYPVGIGTRTGHDLTTILQDYEPGRDYDETLPAELEGQRTRLNMTTLSLLAQRSGGRTFMIDSLGSSAAGFLRDVVESHRAVSFQLIPNRQKQEVWQYLVVAGILVLALAVLFY